MALQLVPREIRPGLAVPSLKSRKCEGFQFSIISQAVALEWVKFCVPKALGLQTV